MAAYLGRIRSDGSACPMDMMVLSQNAFWKVTAPRLLLLHPFVNCLIPPSKLPEKAIVRRWVVRTRATFHFHTLSEYFVGACAEKPNTLPVLMTFLFLLVSLDSMPEFPVER
jgi:hypothetical protein